MNPATRKKLVAAGTALLVVLLLIVGGNLYLQQKYTKNVQDVIAHLAPDYVVTYEKLNVKPFAGEAILQNVAIAHNGEQLARIKQLILKALDAQDGVITDAKISASALEFSPFLHDLSKTTSTDSIVTGDLKADYKFESSTQSYFVKDFSFNSEAQKIQLQFADAKLANIVLAENTLRKFSFGVTDGSYTAPERAPVAGLAEPSQKTIKFSTAFDYEQLENNGGYAVRNFSYNLPDTQNAGSIKEAVVSYTPNAEVPANFLLNISGLDMPINTGFIDLSEYWKDYGYTRVAGDIKVNYDFDPETKKIPGAISLDLRDMYKFNMSFVINGINPAEETRESLAQKIWAQAVRLESADINFSDASFLKKTIEIGAKNEGVEIPAYIETMGQKIAKELGADKDADPAIVDAAGKFKSYLSTLGTMTISLRPVEAVPIMDVIGALIMDRAKLLKNLGMTVTVS